MHRGADAIAPYLLEPQTRVVIAGHSASEGARERRRPGDPKTFGKILRKRWMHGATPRIQRLDECRCPGASRTEGSAYQRRQLTQVMADEIDIGGGGAFIAG